MLIRHWFIICLIPLLTACPLSSKYRAQVEVKSRHQTFDLQKISEAKIAIMPIRDFSDHFGAVFSATLMNSFVGELKQKFPKLELTQSEAIAKLLDKTGKKEDYNLFVDKCITDNKYCIEENELLRLFKDSGINYAVSITIGTLTVPGPVGIVVYYLSVTVYDIDLGGQVVYNAFSEDEIYLTEEDTTKLLMGLMRDISREVVAKM